MYTFSATGFEEVPFLLLVCLPMCMPWCRLYTECTAPDTIR